MADVPIQQTSMSIDKECDIEKQQGISAAEDERTDLRIISSHATNHDMQPVLDQYTEQGDDVYERFSHRRKMAMTAVLSFCGFLAPISSTTVLSAVPEVAATFHTNGSIINLTNALYLVFMVSLSSSKAKPLAKITCLTRGLVQCSGGRWDRSTDDELYANTHFPRGTSLYDISSVLVCSHF